MPRRYDKSDLRAESNGAKMSTDKLRKELGLRKAYTQIAAWSQPYEVLAARGRTIPVQQPKPKQVQQPVYKPKFNKLKPKNKQEFKKAF